MNKEASNLNLFDDSEGIVLPCNNAETGSTGNVLESMGITEAISGTTVKSMLIPEVDNVIIPCYLIDLRNTKATRSTTLGLTALLREDGDTAIYIQNPVKIIKLGMGNESVLYNVMSTAIHHMFSGKAKLYKNTGSGFNPVDDSDVSNVILRL